MISVLIVDDEALVRGGFRAMLEAQADIEVAGEAADGEQAVELARELRPDVILMDIRMPRLDGLEATRRLLARAGDERPRVLVLTTFDRDLYVYEALKAGASGFLLKDTPPTELLRAVRLAAAGDSMLSPGVTRRVIERFTAEDRSQRRRAALGRLDVLTEREREVLVQIGLGHANADIAKRLHLSEATVKSHITHLFEKLAVTNRVQLAIAAFRAGLVE